MKKLANTMKSLWNDESAQGATEYIVLLAVVVIVVVIFRDKIKTMVTDKLNNVSTGMQAIDATSTN
ncbi:MAG: Flp1 family type IVb pilin [Bdellovibrionota bacterium]